MTSNNAPYRKTPVGQSAVTYGAEAGYDILGLSDRIQDRLFVFGRYEYYDPYVPASDQQDYTFTDVHRIAAGINWLPIPQIAVKAEFSERFRPERYNNEPSVSIGIAYMGFFK
jgi:hypothetical protein